MANIQNISSRQIISSSGHFTIETTVVLDNGITGTASVPAQDHISKYSAVNFLDLPQNITQEKKVMIAISNVQNVIAPKLIGKDILKQQEIDETLLSIDGSQNKSRLGASATLSVSTAAAKAAARSLSMPLFIYLRQFITQGTSSASMPVMFISIVNGGNNAENLMDFNDLFIIPASFKSLTESVHIGISTYINFKNNLTNKNFNPLYSADGSLSIQISKNEEIFPLLNETLESLNQRIGYDVFLGLDADASSFYNNDKRYILRDSSMPYTSDALISYYTDLIDKYHIFYIEDPLSDDDWEGWQKISGRISGTVIAGDSLTATNPYRVQMALNQKIISAVSINPIQIGTLYEAMMVINIARASGIKIVISHQKGSLPDDFIADFAIAVNADYVNFGPFTRGENVLNYNRLLEIERLLKKT